MMTDPITAIIVEERAKTLLCIQLGERLRQNKAHLLELDRLLVERRLADG